MQERRLLHLLLLIALISTLLLQTQTTALAAPPSQQVAVWPELALDAVQVAHVINITAAGFDPPTLSVFGPTEVTWINKTNTTQTLRGGDGTTSGATNLFLPLVQRGSTIAVEAAATYLDYLYQQADADNFTATLAPNQSFTYRFTAPGVYKFYLTNTPTVQGALTLSGVALLRTSPSTGEGDVAVTRETVLEFSGALDPATVTPAAFAVLAGAKALDYRLVLSADKQRVTLFYKNSLPGSTRVRVSVDGSKLKDAQGNLVDLDGDGAAGGNALLTFDTLSLTVIPGTVVCGRVFASELAITASNVSVNTPLQGVTVSVDGLEEALRTITDSAGNFCLNPAPAGRFFVHIDGHSATNPIPAGQYYPVVGKAWQSVPGQRTTVGDVFLPLIPANTLQAVSQSQDTQITFADSVLQAYPDLQGVSIVVPADALFSDDGERGGKVGIAPVPPDRLPGTLPDGLNFPVVITVQTDGAGNFDTPAPVCFPNLADQTTGQPLPASSKSALWSFNHDTGNWEIVGPMTVSADGRMVCTDAGVGIRAPGWHGTNQGTPAQGPKKHDPPTNPNDQQCPKSVDLPKWWDVASTFATCLDTLLQAEDLLKIFLESVKQTAELVSIIEKVQEDYKNGKASTAELRGNIALIKLGKDFIRSAIDVAKGGPQSPIAKFTGAVDCFTSLLGLLESPCKTVASAPDGCYSAITKSACKLREDVQGPLKAANKAVKQITDSLTEASLEAICNAADAIIAYLDARGQAAAVDEIDPQLVTLLDHLAIQLEPLDLPTVDADIAAITQSFDGVTEIYDAMSDAYVAEERELSNAYIKVGYGNFTQRSKTSALGSYSFILPPKTIFTLMAFDPGTGRCGTFVGKSADVGQNTELHGPVMVPCLSADSDNDQLLDIAENIVGTDPNNPDTDGDVINDGAEVQQGRNPLDGLAVATGIIATADTTGNAVDICAVNDLIAVADGETGVTFFNVFNGATPTIVNQVDTPGEAQALACASGRVAVADGAAGLAIIDATTPATAKISRQLAVGNPVQAVAVAGNVAYASTASGEVVAIDLTNGTTLGQVTVTGDVRHLAVYGDLLYVLTGDMIHTILLQELPLQISASVPTAASGVNQRLFVAESTLYLIHSNGYNTFSLTDPTRPTLIAAGSTGQNGWQQLVTNGSGLGVAVLGANVPDDISLYDVRDPLQTDVFQTTFTTPGQAQAVTLYNGQAYAADGEAGMQVINYLAADTKGITPTIALASNFAPGVAEEKAPMRLTATTSDDVQVRNVEFYMDGNRIATDGNYPFEVWITTPALANQPSFTLRAKATDTGGKTAWTTEQTITLVADATPPRVTTTTPAANSFVPPNSVTAVSATFSEALNGATVNNTTFQLFNAGPDKLLDTADDQPVAGTVTYDAANKTARLTFGAALSDGRYRAVLAAGITDAAGNPLKGGAYQWRFSAGVITWDGGGDGTSWHDPQNWEEDRLPTTGAIVVIDGPVNGAVVYTQDDLILTSLQSSKPLQLTGGKLTLNQTSTINSPLTMSGGELSGPGPLTVSGMLEWSGGTMSGSGKTVAQGGLTLNGYQVWLDGRSLDNVGAATWSYPNYHSIGLSNGASFNNLAGASFTDQGSSDGFTHQIYGDGTTQFNNQGSYTKLGGSDVTYLSLPFNNTGAVNVDTGMLTLANGNSSGSSRIASGATLQVSGDYTFVSSATSSGAGYVEVAGGTVTFTGNQSLVNLRLSGGTLTGPNTLTVSGMLEWSGGTMSGSGKTVAQGGLTLNGYQVWLDGRSLDNVGAATWSYPNYHSIGLSNGASFNNLAGASFTDQGSSDGFTHQIYGDGTAQFNNQGTYTKAGGTDSTSVSIPFNNTGTVNVNTGILQLTNGNSSGTMTINAGNTLGVHGTFENKSGGLINGNGTLDLTNATFTNNGTIAPTVTVIN